MSELAIFGGQPVRTKKFPAYKYIGEEERKAVGRVIESGVLSRFLGAWHEDFYGGPEVRALEKEWAEYFGVKNAISVNSATAGLQAAVGAIGTSPGDEIIVTPYSMCISATAPLFYGAIPVFADIEEDYFCLDPVSIENKISPKTKAIIVVDIFGQPYDAEQINTLAKKHGLIVIEDAAQAPYAKYRGKFAGTLGDIGIYSLNYHKHIHTGEGGMVVTNDDKLAERIKLIRNHAEAVVEGKEEKDLVNMIGFNFRMTEMEAAIGRTQLKKLASLIGERIENCDYLSKKFSAFPGIKVASVRDGATHVYYMHVFYFDDKIIGVGRNKFVEAVKAELPLTELRESEGVKMGSGYVKPIYLMPVFQNRIAFGKNGWPFSLARPAISYSKGICPVAERMYEREVVAHEFMCPPVSKDDLDDIVKALGKVYEHRRELLRYNGQS